MTTTPKLDQINLISADFEKSVAFYDIVGIAHPEIFRNSSGTPVHAGGHGGEGIDHDIDSPEFAGVWNAGWKGASDLVGKVVVGFRVATREEVDHRASELEAAGYKVLQPPYDAFWGARYAIIEDPDGIAVGLMSPPDDAFRSRPPEPGV